MESLGDTRLPTRFWSKVEVTYSGCWLWRGAVARGYGHFRVGSQVRGAHVYAYECLVGPVPKGLELDHRCHDPKQCVGGVTCIHRRCVNPAHLEPVTGKINSERGGNTNHDGVCKNGLHPWDGADVECRPCERERKRRYGMQVTTCAVCGQDGLMKHRARHAQRHVD